MNIILLIFVMLATVFLTSSINNILVVMSGTDFYFSYAKIPDVNLYTLDIEEKNEIEEWLDSESELVSKHEYLYLDVLDAKNVVINKENGDTQTIDSGQTIYLGKHNDGDYLKTYDDNGNTYELEIGEIALSTLFMDKYDLNSQDEITIRTGNTTKKFTIGARIKDAISGSEMLGMTRFLVSDEDFAEMSTGDGIGAHCIETKDTAAFNRAIATKDFQIASNISKSMYKLAYIFDTFLAALLIAFGVCMILIALFVLRFTLVFTLEEEYRTIGILKAIGFKDFSIRKLYLIKYFVIVITGASAGLILSIPVSLFMVDSVSTNIILESGNAYFYVNVLCTVLLVIMVMGFCFFCTRKLEKMSAISAIKDGSTGERFTKKSPIRLHKRKKMPVYMFLGINDILTNSKRHLVLLFTFCISIILITIPLNMVHTMSGSEMVAKLSINPDASVCIEATDILKEGEDSSSENIESGMDRLKSELEDEGYENVSISSGVFYAVSIEGMDSNRVGGILTIQPIGNFEEYREYSIGTAPVEEDEIAVSEKILNDNGWSVGDSVIVSIGDIKDKMIITGVYSDYMQLGQSARMNQKIDLNGSMSVDNWYVEIQMDNDLTEEKLIEKLEEQFPEYKFLTSREVINENVGSIMDILSDLVVPMTAILCIIIILITALMEKLFIVREKGEIAMMISMGISLRHIRGWQISRMVITAVVAAIISVPVSFFSNRLLLRPIYGIMGAEITVQADPIRSYIIYPGILLICIIAITTFTTREIKKVRISDLNNIE
ncbi:MAG: FtsX-like permease family protein [Suipraeoptans sp.]